MIYSIGHSTLSAQDFAVAASAAKSVLDVRSHPTSRWEQFRKENMEVWLPEHEIGYEWWPSLGGWDKRHSELAPRFEAKLVDVSAYVKGKFPKQRIAKGTIPEPSGQLDLPSVRPAWTNQGLYDYSWFMTLPEFLDGVDALVERGAREDVAIMCCEAVPWRCHRSMVCDYLSFLGVESFHILGGKHRAHSSMLGNRLERYDPEVVETWCRRRGSNPHAPKGDAF